MMSGSFNVDKDEPYAKKISRESKNIERIGIWWYDFWDVEMHFMKKMRSR